MNKFNQLLNENTIVNFRLLWKLGVRYRLHFYLAIVFCGAIFAYTYLKQPIIYAVNVPLKSVYKHTVSKDLSALLPVDDAASINLNELKVSLESFTFLKSYAVLVSEDPMFDNLNFGSIALNTNIYGKELKTTCGKDKECLYLALAGALRQTFSIEQGLTENRFILGLSSVDKATVERLISILIKAIEQNRINARQYLVLKEMQNVESLISKNQSMIEERNGYKALEDQEKVQNSISDLKEKMRMLQHESSTEIANVKALESRLIENKRSTASKGDDTLEDFEKMKKKQARLSEINQNIGIISDIPEEKRTESDYLILSQLKEERQRIQKDLPSAPARKKIEVSEKFIEGQRSKAEDYEFEYQVAKNKLLKLNEDYEQAKFELNELLQRKIVNENEVVSMKSDLEFLKNLESKLMSLKLLNATMTSDLVFEDINVAAREFRRLSYVKTFVFSFILTVFLYFLSIFIRFLRDDRIYGEEDIRCHFNKLDFVGEVPIFE